MRRFRRLWLILVGVLVVVMAVVILWPRPDKYAYLRGLHPVESYVFDDVLDQNILIFTFKIPSDRLAPQLAKLKCRSTWSFVEIIEDAPAKFNFGGQIWFLPSGERAYLADHKDGTTTLAIQDEHPSWLQSKLLDLRNFLHIN